MDAVREKLHLPNKAAAFALLAGSVAAVCFSGLGLLFLSRWVQG
jgi:hypothetical protein